MPKRVCLPILFALALSSAALAGTLDDAKLALHVQPVSAKSACLEASNGGDAPGLTPCSEYITQGILGTGYNVYLIATNATEFEQGFTGISCGIEYEAALGQGVDVFGWTRCSDLDFPTDGPNGAWPSSASSNRITWASCQTARVPGFEEEGAIAIAGAFYVYAYSPDLLRITPNKNVELGPELVVTDCDGAEIDLSPTTAAFAVFSSTGNAGCNPCLGPCPSDAACIVHPLQLNFSGVAAGSFLDLDFTITNTTTSQTTGAVSLSCPDFAVVAGEGPYTLDPGATMPVTVRFSPTSEGIQTCTVSTGNACPDVFCTGSTQGLTEECVLDVSSINFGAVDLGVTVVDEFLVTNTGDIPTTVTLVENCAPFSVLGLTEFALGPGESRAVSVLFEPVTLGGVSCDLNVFPCGTVSLRGFGINTGALLDARVALHVKPASSKSICDPADQGGEAPTDIPCFQYDPSGDLLTGYDLYLIAYSTDTFHGIAGAAFGIDYGPNLGAFGWSLCGDLEFPGNNWPASGGGNIITWDRLGNCQENTVPGFESEGIFAVMGAIYVYAYGDATFQYTERLYVLNPEIKLASCSSAEIDILGVNRGMARFSAGAVEHGFNPCGSPTPVDLLALSATRTAGGAEIRWEVAGLQGDYSGFQVFQTTEDGVREPISHLLLPKTSIQTWIDPSPPAVETEYWLAAILRTGQREWLGSTTLPAAVSSDRFVLKNQYPNPFRSTTAFFIQVPAESAVTLKIFDAAGREVGRCITDRLPAGEHRIDWDARDARGSRLRAGVYFYRLESEHGGIGGKLVLLQ